jgi:hypothetical protein
MTPQRIIGLCVVLVLLILVPVIKHDILGGATYINLPSAPPLAGVVSQSLGGASNNGGSFPVDGKDYKLSVRYFDNTTWAVGIIQPLNSSINGSTVVLEKQQGTYQAVIGPASAVPTTELQGLPTDVSDYTKANIAVYQPEPDTE